MVSQKEFLNWFIGNLKDKLSKEYSEVKINYIDDKTHEFEGHYPNLILSNYGMVMSIVLVLGDSDISADKVNKWKEMSTLGAKLTLMVPDRAKKKVMDLLWERMIAQNVAVGSYELKINMP